MRTALSVWGCLAALATTAAAQADPPQVRHADAIAQARVVCDDEPVGTVSDLVIDLAHGVARGVVVALDADESSRRVEVPWSVVTVRDGLVSVELDRDELAALPDFDPRRLDAMGIPPETGDASSPDGGPPAGEGKANETSKGKPAEAAKKSGQEESGAAEPKEPRPLRGAMLLSDLAKLPLHGSEGASQGAALDLSSGAIAFLMVAPKKGGSGDSDVRPVPWSLCVPVADVHAPSHASILVDVEPDALAKAPTLTAVVLADPLHRRQVYRHFHVSAPTWERDG